MRSRVEWLQWGCQPESAVSYRERYPLHGDFLASMGLPTRVGSKGSPRESGTIVRSASMGLPTRVGSKLTNRLERQPVVHASMGLPTRVGSKGLGAL